MKSAQIITLIAAASWIYWPDINGNWLWDDNLYFSKNNALLDWSGLLKIWFVPGTLWEYYPITETVQWFQWRLWGNNTFGYHLTNVTLHILNACLLWHLLRKCGLHFAWMGALLFAIHPMNVESVAWISELKNTLSLGPALLCVNAFINYESGGANRYYWQSLGLFGIGMLCKNTLICLPLWLLLYIWWKHGRVTLSDLMAVVPFFLIAILSATMTMWAALRYEQNHGARDSTAVISHNLLSFVILTASANSFYLLKYIYPFDLVAFYPPLREDTTSPFHLLQMAFLCVGAFLLIRCHFKWRREVILGFGFFFINLLPIVFLIFAKYPFVIWSLDHAAYLPFLGLIGLTVAGFEQLYRSLSGRLRPLSLVGIMFLALPISIYSRSYASCFVDAKGLWIYTLQHSPDSRSNQGNMLKNKDL
jgi:hypothetical protein